MSVWLVRCHLCPFIRLLISWHPLRVGHQRGSIVVPGLLRQIVAMCFLASSAYLWPGPGSSEPTVRIAAWASCVDGNALMGERPKCKFFQARARGGVGRSKRGDETITAEFELHTRRHMLPAEGLCVLVALPVKSTSSRYQRSRLHPSPLRSYPKRCTALGAVFGALLAHRPVWNDFGSGWVWSGYIQTDQP